MVARPMVTALARTPIMAVDRTIAATIITVTGNGWTK
jgi:hypothetical protein